MLAYPTQSKVPPHAEEWGVGVREEEWGVGVREADFKIIDSCSSCITIYEFKSLL